MREFVFESLPGDIQCHASNLLITRKGVQATVFFAGTAEGQADTAIWMVIGKYRPFCVAKLALQPHWNPVLMQEGEDKGGGLLLYFKTGLSPSSWVTHVMNLSQPSSLRTLHDKDGLARGPVRTSILVLSNGDWLAASSHEVNVPMVRQYPPPVIWDAFVDRSTDCGETWERSPFIPYDRKRFGEYGGVIQPVMWESTPGNIHMLLRSTIGHICRSDSSDYGKTWSPITATALPNNNSGIDVVKNPMTGVVALVYNPVGDNWGARSPLSVAFSSGEGRDWSAPVNIEEGWGSFSYPSIRPSGEGFALTYTWNRLRIACTEFQVDPKDFQTDIEVAVNLKPSSV